MRNISKLLSAGVVAASFAIAAPASANLLVNGSFETGTLAGWSFTGNTGFTSVCSTDCTGYGPEQGTFYVDEGPIGPDGFLSQTFVDTPGGRYHVTGWLAGNGTAPSDFGMQWNGVDHIVVSPVPSQAYTEYSFFATGTGLDTFTARFANDPSFDGIDNFQVNAPEPATLALFGAGLAGLGAMRRRRKAKV